MKITYDSSELEKVKKILIILEKDFDDIDKKAQALGREVKTEKQLKDEIKLVAEKPEKPKGKSDKV